MENENQLEKLSWKKGKLVNVAGEKINATRVGSPHVDVAPLMPIKPKEN